MKTFATAVHCIDGRIQIPVIDYIRAKSGVDYVDVITQPGVAGLLANNENASVWLSIKERINISLEAHLSKDIWIAAHHDCAANLVDDVAQKAQVLQSAEFIRKSFPQIHVYGIWVDRDFKVQEVG